ncbi:MAG: LanC-like protein, partial [Acetobacteraceae bacterium]|nr:LanC-like protein [Acetobacteraceae bacterium]
MFQRSRHFTPEFKTWDQTDARQAIAEIATDAISNVDATNLWLAHPMDDHLPDGNGSLYFGAAGVVWALDYLHRVGAITGEYDLAPLLVTALERNAPWFAATRYSRHASLLMGELGILLVQMGVAPDQGLADGIYTLLASNTELPIVELMWGLPGCMLSCLHMHAMTNDERFARLFQLQAARLLADLEKDDNGPIWTQELYGRRQRWLGPVHGFTGNMAPLLQGWDWLSEEQRATIADSAQRTLAAHVVCSELGCNWPSVVPSSQPPAACQYCHGAPGIVTTFADARFSSPDFDNLLLRGGELTWNAGPLVKGSGLCHGTGGNGYALLKLYKRTGDSVWLDRARAFAMAAIDQVRGARAAFGRGR